MLQEEHEIIPYQTTDLTGKRVFVFAPHPDDETIGCGGALALHTRAGDPVKVIFLTNGAKGNFSGKTDRKEYIALRKKEAIKASGILGVKDVVFWEYEDRNLAGSREAIPRMIKLLQKHKPQIIYVPSPLEFHPDHRAASLFVCEAIKCCAWDFRVAFYEIGQPMIVNCLVDISQMLDRKTVAINAYKSQLREAPYGDISLALNRFRSLTLSKETTHAEGFFLIRSDPLRTQGVFVFAFHCVNRIWRDCKDASLFQDMDGEKWIAPS